MMPFCHICNVNAVSVYIFLIISFIADAQVLIPIRNVNFTTSSELSQSGATLTILQPEDITRENNGWKFNSGNNQSTWHMKIALDPHNGWFWNAYGADIISMLTLVIDSDETLPINGTDKDLIIAFQTGSQYFSLVISIDNQNPNWVFPTNNIDSTCDIDTSNDDNMVPLAVGDVTIDVANTSLGNDLEARVSRGWARSSMNPQNLLNADGNDHPNTWPIKLIIESNPNLSSDDYVKVTLTNPVWELDGYSQSCVFRGFGSDLGSEATDIYISPDEAGQTFRITKFGLIFQRYLRTVTLTEDPTKAPTRSAINNPTKSPSDFPTTAPTDDPSI